MFCQNCGWEISEETMYCPYCGQPVNNNQENGALQGAPEPVYDTQPGAYMSQNQYQYQPIPPRQLKTDRGVLKYILFTLLTCGIYGIVFWSSVGEDMNYIASRRDGRKTMHYCLLSFVIAPITCGIGVLVWNHKLAERIGEEARVRGIDTDFDAVTFWLWGVLGIFILVGPYVYVHKLCNVMNEICTSYNQNGM